MPYNPQDDIYPGYPLHVFEVFITEFLYHPLIFFQAAHVNNRYPRTTEEGKQPMRIPQKSGNKECQDAAEVLRVSYHAVDAGIYQPGGMVKGLSLFHPAPPWECDNRRHDQHHADSPDRPSDKVHDSVIARINEPAEDQGVYWKTGNSHDR